MRGENATKPAANTTSMRARSSATALLAMLAALLPPVETASTPISGEVCADDLVASSSSAACGAYVDVMLVIDASASIAPVHDNISEVMRAVSRNHDRDATTEWALRRRSRPARALRTTLAHAVRRRVRSRRGRRRADGHRRVPRLQRLQRPGVNNGALATRG